MYKAIAIDGPSGAGKSTIARKLAERLNYIYVDTGAMYRATALYCINNHIDTDNVKAVEDVLDHIDIQLKYIDGVQFIYLNGVNVSNDIRTQFVSEHTSKISVIKSVRKKLVSLQKEIAKSSNVVMDGRDIGTVVLPHAETKIFLTASVEVRTARRINDLKLLGRPADYETVKAEIEKRDFRDMNRATDPLKMAEDAVLIDSGNMKAEEVIEEIIKLNHKGKGFN